MQYNTNNQCIADKCPYTCNIKDKWIKQTRSSMSVQCHYTNQSCYVKWGNEHSDSFNVSNSVKQGGVISPLLFSRYIDQLFSQLEHSGLGCHVGASYAGAFGYADDIALVAPSMQCLKKMIVICEKYANSHSITFNPNKSKLLCFNVVDIDVIPQTYLNGEVIPLSTLIMTMTMK